MFRLKPAMPAKKVWRITETAPMGEWVVNAPPVAARLSRELPEVSYGTWVTSSYDLLDGADVVEDPDTVPGELLDELFPQWQASTKRPPK